MHSITLNTNQSELIQRPLDSKIFLEGPAGSGKTTTGVERMLYLIETGIPGDSILIILPQRTLGKPYQQALNTLNYSSGGIPTLVTVGGLAQRQVSLFWPLIAQEARFGQPRNQPNFLTLETAQYYMARLVKPLLKEGYFDSVVIDRNRLFSQIIDSLNKAAVVGFPLTEIGDRLKRAWSGEPGQLRVYDDVQTCASLFRQFCLEHNLLDFSLQLEVFIKHLWPKPWCRDYLSHAYHHLIVDNLEEDTPIAHDLMRDWLPNYDSALLIYDQDAGYRQFLGADPESAYTLSELCQERMVFDQSFITSEPIHALEICLGSKLRKKPPPQTITSPALAMAFEFHRFYPDMLDWVALEISKLVIEERFSPGEIVVLAPFLSDSLRFAVTNRLQNLNIPTRSHRPSRSLREEPATLCLLTLAALAHPQWNIHPNIFDVAYALMQAVYGLDLVRAQMLSEIVYRTQDGIPVLSGFDQIIPETQERITYRLGERYEHLRQWLCNYANDGHDELDIFLVSFFGEILSQPGYGFHANYDAGRVTANLVESVRKFRRVVASNLSEAGISPGKEYIQMVQEGVIAAQYINSWQTQEEDAVLVAPAHTFLMNNQPVQVQFWLDIGNRSWSERLDQPLTHPYVLSRHWPESAVWTDIEEYETSQDNLYRLVTGLIRRCGQRIYLGLSSLGEQGYEQRGPLLRAFQRLLQDHAVNFPLNNQGVG